MNQVEASWCARDAVAVARDLVGAELRRGEVVLRVTEVEAYCEGDSAAHCRSGKTARNAPLWGPPGRLYVYLCYGLHHLVNIVTGREGSCGAVLIRAAEVVAGAEEVLKRRGQGVVTAGLLAGPGKVGQGLGLDGSWNGHPVFEAGGVELWVGAREEQVRVGPRVGVEFASAEDQARLWRFADARSRAVTVPRTLGLEGATGGREA